MHQCLLDPQDGYYTQHVAFGEDGDFITAPMVSQMFGEMIGVWVAQVWHNMGSPDPFRLVEVGAGGGELMSDILRVIAKVPSLRDVAQVTFVEPAGNLARQQIAAVPGAQSVDTLDHLPTDMPVVLLANEVLDCLPARQFVLTDRGWCERCVGVRNDDLAFGLVEIPDFTPPFAAEPGEVIEVSFEQARFSRQLANLLKSTTGAALLIDYGRDNREPGDTLQALYRHHKHAPLDMPGRHDLTQWADFPTVLEMAVKTDVKSSGITPQSAFLMAMGIDARCEALITQNPSHADIVKRQYERLMAADYMGNLFKVVALAYPRHIGLPGLEGQLPKG